jgi:hypothetical protein
VLANNKQQYSTGKIMAVAGNAPLTINQTLTAKEGTELANAAIRATHYYIKFKPRNEADYNLLKADSNLVIYPFPLHTNDTRYGANYRDPSVPAGVPTYQYASVPISYVLPNVPYVKLADLYLPDVSNESNTITLKGAGGSAYQVSARALANETECREYEIDPIETEKIDLDDCDPGIGYGGGGSPGDPNRNGENWRPHGRLTVTDDVLGLIGVEGIKVRARRWFTTYTGISDANGDYVVDGWYTRPANYWLDFERHDFAIKIIDNINKEISGPKQEGAWNLEFTGYDKFCATIFRAAHHYYRDIHGLKRPPMNSLLAAKLHIVANLDFLSTSSGVTFPISWHLGEKIHIYGSLSSSVDTYSTTIHEITHAAHWDNSNLSFLGNALSVSESWATGVEWYLTNLVYPGYKGVNWSLGNPKYRNIVMDLLDNPSSPANWGAIYPNDQVEGYSILQIQNACIDQPTTWNEWKMNIINNYNNGTEQHVEALFNYWLN